MRGDNAVHTQLLKRVVLTDEIRALVDRGVGENSPWLHDRTLTDASSLPTVDEMKDSLGCYEELLATLAAEERVREAAASQRRKQKKATLKAGEGT